MRRLTASNDRERGGIAVIIALLMVVLLGFAAISIDVARLYSERAQLQNGSDSAALMVAQKCAKDADDENCHTSAPLAAGLANGNALDGKTGVKSISLDTVGRTVTVTTGAKETGSAPNSVSLFFAKVFGISSTEVNASSSVQWGSPVKGTSPFPIAFSICQVSTGLETGLQLLQSHSPSDSKGTPGCTFSGQAVPGGFSWITQSEGQCGGVIDLSVSVSYSNTGNNAPDNCVSTVQGWAASINAGKEVIVLLPVFDTAAETGTSAYYHLISFAAFSIKGWKLASGNGTNASLIFRNTKSDLPSDKQALACTGDCRGIIGSFVNYVSLADGYQLGPVSPYGATVVELTS